jgi:hypothetical protein
MTKSRAFNRFHRWTAKLRRRHLKAWLPEPREGEPIMEMPGGALRQRARALDELHALEQEAPQLLLH